MDARQQQMIDELERTLGLVRGLTPDQFTKYFAATEAFREGVQDIMASGELDTMIGQVDKALEPETASISLLFHYDNVDPDVPVPPSPFSIYAPNTLLDQGQQ